MRHVVIEIPLIKLGLLSIYSAVCFPAPASSRFSTFLYSGSVGSFPLGNSRRCNYAVRFS